MIQTVVVTKDVMEQGMLIWMKCPLKQEKIFFTTPIKEIMEVDTEVPMTLLVVGDATPIDLVADMMVIMVPQVKVMVALWMVPRDLGLQIAPHPLPRDLGLQIAPHPQTLKKGTGMTDIHNMDQFKNSMIAMNNSLIDMLHCQEQAQNDMTCILKVMHQSQRDHTNDSLIDDIPTFYGKLELYFNWILKFENTTAVITWNPKRDGFRKSSGCSYSACEIFISGYKLEQCEDCPETAVLFILTVTHTATPLMHQYQQNRESLHKFNFYSVSLFRLLKILDLKI